MYLLEISQGTFRRNRENLLLDTPSHEVDSGYAFWNPQDREETDGNDS
jgi:hypothetical protein